MGNLNEFEKYLLEKLEKMDDKIDIINRKLAYGIGIGTTIATALSIIFTKFI
jgi:hypothetical protein